MNAYKILIVDDDIMSLEMLTVMLESQGHQCLKALNGRLALDLLEVNTDTDIIVLDLEMPVMNGYEMLSELKNSYLKDIPVIVVSAKQSGVLKTLQLGANDFVSKPYAPEELEVRITNLITSRRAAESSNRSKNEFISIVSHELRTPMNGIIGMADYLLACEASPHQQEGLGIIRQSAHNLLKIINNILDFTNAEDGYANLAPLPFNFAGLVKQEMYDLKAAAEAKGVILHLDAPSDIPAVVLGYSARVAKVLVNILDNAIKFTLSGSIIVSIGAENITGDGIRLSCSVKDTGIGITPEVQQLIFKPFVQADGSSIRKFGGIGLGLTTSSRLIESMDGSISVQSNPGSGSTFTFTFMAQTQQILAVSAEQTEARADRSLSILLAEDIQVNQLVAVRLLEKLGHRVTIANNGVEAVEKWRQDAYNLIFMDVQMPEMDGYQATMLIRKEEHETGCHIPILALTANALENDERACLKSGMDGYLTKPLRKDSLVKALEMVMEQGHTLIIQENSSITA